MIFKGGGGVTWFSGEPEGDRLKRIKGEMIRKLLWCSIGIAEVMGSNPVQA